MPHSRAPGALLLLVLTALLPASEASAQPVDWRVIERLSVTSDGADGNGFSDSVAISSDGRFVAFDSYAALVADDTNGGPDVYVRDRATDTTVRMSVRTDGQQGSGSRPSLSADGRFVAFESGAALVADDSNELLDIYVRDRDTDADGIFDEAGAVQTRRISVTSAGDQFIAGTNERPFVSPDGRWVVFVSTMPLVAGDTNMCSGFPTTGECPDIFVHDLTTSATVRVNVSSTGAQGDDASPSFFLTPAPSISGNGRFVIFASEASNLVPGDTNGEMDVFLHDRDTDGDGIYDEAGSIATTRVSLSNTGNQLADPGVFGDLAITPDARFIAFGAFAAVIPGDPNPGGGDIYLRDRTLGTIEQIGRAESFLPPKSCCGNWLNRQSLSADGRFVAFHTFRNIGVDDGMFLYTLSVSEIAIYDRSIETLTLVTDAPDPSTNLDPQLSSSRPALASQALALAFVSSDPGVVPDLFDPDPASDAVLAGTAYVPEPASALAGGAAFAALAARRRRAGRETEGRTNAW